MAYVAPSTVTTLQTYTSSAHNIIVNDIIDHESRINQYAGVYTNEAARDAAITSPTEGMRVYLTAPTVPAATGDTTYIPTGIQTIYNGSAWVCVTEIGAYTTAVGTTTSTTFTPTLSGSPGTNPSVTLSTGTTALVDISAVVSPSTAATMYVSPAVSGATTIAAGAVNGFQFAQSNGGYVTTVSNRVIISGLTSGTNTFTLNYAIASGTLTVQYRRIMVRSIA